MSTIIPNFLTAKEITNLDTYVYTTNTTANHVARIRVQPPVNTGLTVSILWNSTTMATMTLVPVLPYTAQSSQSLSATIPATSGDTVSFVLSSSTPADKGLNAVKATLNVHIGAGN
jgi:hypothetical protein